MARIVLACWGSYRDSFPYLAIATELKALGHTPVVCSCPYYQGLVEQEGFEFRPLRPDVQPDNTALLERIMDPQRGSEVIIRELIVASLRQSYDDITAAVEGADLLLSHPITFAAPLVATKRGLPWMASVLAPLSFFSLHDFPALPNAPQVVRLTRLTPWAGRALLAMARRITGPWVAPVVAMRAALGLPPAGDPLYEASHPRQPRPLLTGARRCAAGLAAAHQVTGFPFFNRAIPMPAELSAFLDAGEPPLVFTLGSAAVNTAGSFFDESARAVAMLGARAVLLVGPNPANRPASLPPGAIAVDRAPHDQVFPRASAIVHQGGVGTTGQAMRSGRPELIVPFAHDQPDNAFRVQQLGAARVVYPRRYRARPRRPRAEDAADRRATPRLLRVGQRVRAERGAAAAADAIVALLANARR